MSANLGTAWIQVKPSMDGVRGSILNGLNGTGAQFGDNMGKEVKNSRGMTVGMAAVWGAASAVAFKAIDTISQTLTDSLSGAIRRVDTLNNSSRTFANMGFSADVTRSAINDLDKSIRGLPTPLDQAIRGMTSLAATYGDVQLGGKMFTALNNAILGFGGTVEMVDNAILQISQMPMDGPLDAQTWNSLRNSGLTPVLVAMSKEMGLSISEMKEQFGEGELKVQDFVSALIKMNKDGGGGLKSLEQIAKDSTAGINTGMANAQTAVERGMASIIKAIGPANISGAIAATGKAFEVGLTAIANGIIALPRIIDQFRVSVENMINFVKSNIGAFAAFGIAAGALAAPFAIAAASALILDLRIRAMLLWDKVIKVIKATAIAFRVLSAAMAANPIGLIIAAIGVLVGTFMLLWKNNESFRNFFIGAWTQIQKTFGTVTAAISKFATETFGGLQRIVGEVTTAVQNFITAGLGALNTALQATKTFLEDNRTTLTNIAIVITTLMLPMLMKLGLQFLAAAAQAVVSAAQTAGAWIAAHARMAASNTVTFAQMSARMVATAVTSSIQAAIAGAAWIKNAALVSFAWVTQTLPSLIAGFVRASISAVAQAGIAAGAWIMQAGRVLLSWGATFIAYGIGVATAATQTLLAGARMAAGWLLAMGPIGLIIAAVAGAVALIVANWNTVKAVATNVFNGIMGVVNNVINWIRANWPLLLAIITGPIGLAILYVTRNIDQIRAAFSNVVNGIKNVFTGMADIGRNIISGIVSGLSPAPIVNKMKEIASGALNAVKSFLGIKSPSRVMRDQVGKNIGFGIADGIAASTKTAVKAAQLQSASVLGAFSTMIGPSLGMVPQMAGAGSGAAAGGQNFTIINPSPEETAAIVASRIKTQGGDI